MVYSPNRNFVSLKFVFHDFIGIIVSRNLRKSILAVDRHARMRIILVEASASTKPCDGALNDSTPGQEDGPSGFSRAVDNLQ